MRNTFHIIIIVSICLASSQLKAQKQLQDTLLQIQSDTARLHYLRDIIQDAIYTDPTATLAKVHLYDSIARVWDDSAYIARAYNLRGMAHYVNANYDLSIENYIEVLNLRHFLTNQNQLGRLLNNLATTYQVRGDADNSIKYYIQALDIFEKENDALWTANVSGNLGLLLLNSKRLVEAEPKIRSALAYYEINGPTTYQGYTLLNLANLLNEKKSYAESIPIYKEAISLVPESVAPVVAAAANSGIGVAYGRIGSHSIAEKYLLLGLTKAEAIGQDDQAVICHQELSNLYEQRGQYAKSLHHHKAYASLKDSVFTAEQDANMIEALTKYESEIKEQHIALLNTQNELTNERLKGSRRFTIALALGLLLLIGLLYWLYKLNKANRAAANEKDTLLREIHHRVKNNLQVISALLTLQSKYIQDDQAIEALREGQDRVQSMALIHKDLYQHNNLKGVNTKDYLEKLVENLLESYSIGKGTIILDLEIESIWLDVDSMIPLGLLINELVSNSLKHAFHNHNNGRLSISLSEEDNVLHLMVGDNGSGISGDTTLHQKDGFGKSLIDSFSRKLKADITYQHEAGYSVHMHIKEYKKAA